MDITTYAGIRNEDKKVIALFFKDDTGNLVGVHRWHFNKDPTDICIIPKDLWKDFETMQSAWAITDTYSLVKLDDKTPELLLDAIQEIALDTLEKEGTV